VLVIESGFKIILFLKKYELDYIEENQKEETNELQNSGYEKNWNPIK
jgi:hypothetical protein